MKKNAIEVVEKKNVVLSSPSEMITAAMASNADLEKLEKLLVLQERWEANEARKKYAKSFAAAQAKIKAVTKSKLNRQTNSKYADLGDVIEEAQPIYTEEGFAVIFYEGDTTKENHMRVCADILHESGHKESYHYDVPLDGVGIKGNANMTGIHGKASSTSYGRRYLMCMIWNIPTGDDSDGNTQQNQLVTEEDLLKLTEWINAAGKTQESVCKFLEISKLSDMTKPQYAKALSSLKATVAKKETKKETA